MDDSGPCCYCKKNETCIDLVFRSKKSLILDPLTPNDIPQVPWCPCYPYGKCPAEGFPSNQLILWGKCYCDEGDDNCKTTQAANGFMIRPPIRPVRIM